MSLQTHSKESVALHHSTVTLMSAAPVFYQDPLVCMVDYGHNSVRGVLGIMGGGNEVVEGGVK